jgi:dihydrofolate reductase
MALPRDGGWRYGLLMSRNIYYVASSLDGFIADSRNAIDWLLQFGFEPFQEHYDVFFRRIGALVMGSATYEYLLAEEAESWAYGDLPTYVLTSRSLPVIAGADVTFVSGAASDLDERVRASAGDRDVWVVGGGAVAAQYLDAGLLDELRVTIMPVVLGAGVPVLPVASTTPPFRLTGTTPFTGGAVELAYEVDTASR